MRYAIIQYTENGKYDIVDYKRSRISATWSSTISKIVRDHLEDFFEFWYYPQRAANPKVSLQAYLDTHPSYVILYEFDSIRQLISGYPEYFI